MKLNRNFIEEPLHYIKVTDKEGKEQILASKDKSIVEYKALKSAYNPMYEDAGKIVRIPEDYLYKNTRHHLKDFVIIDGKEDANGNKVIIGFLGTSQLNNKSRKLSEGDLIAITKVVVDKTKYKQLIRKSRTLESNKLLNLMQLEEVKEQSKTLANINKSKAFRK